MMGPSWIPDTFAAIMLAVAVVSATRLAVAGAARRWLTVDADADGAHLLMAIAMAGMLAANLRTLPAGVWEPVFGVLTAWFVWRVAVEARGQDARAWPRSCHAPHLVHSVAMLYMFLALRTATGSGGGVGGMSGATGQVLAQPTLALVLALLLAGYTVRDVDRLTAPAAGWLAQPVRVAAGAAAVAVPAGAAGPASTSRWPPFRENSAVSQPAASARGGTVLEAAWLPACCRIVMGVTMAYMLVTMI
jgi:Domain of unknown function (DUF5134)